MRCGVSEGIAVLKKLLSLGAVLVSAALASCGGGGDGTISGGGGGSGNVIVSMGSGIPPTYSEGIISVAVPNLSAGGGTSLTVSLVTADGALYLEDTSITFS